MEPKQSATGVVRGAAFVLMMSALACAGRGRAPEGVARDDTLSAGTVIVTNMSDNTATLVDAGTRRVVATLSTGEGPHEVAVSHDGRWAVVSNYGTQKAAGHTLSVIDVERGAVARVIDVAPHRRPHGMAFLPGDSVLAVTSEASKAVLLVDLRRDSVVATIPTNAGGSHMLALASRTGRIYTSNVPAGSITEQDVAARSALRSVTVAPAVEGIAVTPAGDQVWVGSNERRTVSIVDVARGAVMDTLGGFGMPYRLAVTADGKTAVITDPPKAQVRVVDVATRRERLTVTIPAEGVVSTSEFPGSPSPEGVALSRDGRMAFVTLQGVNQLAVIDLTAGRVVGTAPVGTWPDGVGYSPRRVNRP